MQTITIDNISNIDTQPVITTTGGGAYAVTYPSSNAEVPSVLCAYYIGDTITCKGVSSIAWDDGGLHININGIDPPPPTNLRTIIIKYKNNWRLFKGTKLINDVGSIGQYTGITYTYSYSKRTAWTDKPMVDKCLQLGVQL